MRLKVTEASIHRLSENEAMQLQAEINKATDGKLYFTDEYPHLKQLYQLLNGAFNSSVHGVHMISKRD